MDAVFESTSRLNEELRRLLDALRGLADGRYAALFDGKGVLLESPSESEPGQWALRRFLESSATSLLGIPAALHGGGQMEDAFEHWREDEFFLAFVNGRVGVLVACPDAQRVANESGRLLRAFVDRLLRLNPSWRLDEKGRGLFAGRPRLDTVVIGRAEDPPLP